MFFLVFVLFLDCFFNMHLCAKLQPYSSKFNNKKDGRHQRFLQNYMEQFIHIQKYTYRFSTVKYV